MGFHLNILLIPQNTSNPVTIITSMNKLPVTAARSTTNKANETNVITPLILNIADNPAIARRASARNIVRLPDSVVTRELYKSSGWAIVILMVS